MDQKVTVFCFRVVVVVAIVFHHGHLEQLHSVTQILVLLVLPPPFVLPLSPTRHPPHPSSCPLYYSQAVMDPVYHMLLYPE